jgi:hypothetical protein
MCVNKVLIQVKNIKPAKLNYLTKSLLDKSQNNAKLRRPRKIEKKILVANAYGSFLC